MNKTWWYAPIKYLGFFGRIRDSYIQRVWIPCSDMEKKQDEINIITVIHIHMHSQSGGWERIFQNDRVTNWNFSQLLNQTI